MTKVARSLSNNKYAAVNGANSPSASNVFATMNDLGAINVANLGNSDLGQDSTAREYKLNGDTVNDSLAFKNISGEVLYKMRGNHYHEFGNADGSTSNNITLDGNSAATHQNIYFKTNGHSHYLSAYSNQMYVNGAYYLIMRAAGGNVASITPNGLTMYTGKDIITPIGSKRVLSGAGIHETTFGGSLSNDGLAYKSSAGNEILRLKGDNTFEFKRSNGDQTMTQDVIGNINTSKSYIGSIGPAQQYTLEVQSRLASSSGIALFKNSTSHNVFNFRQSAGAGLLYVANATGVNQITLNGSSGRVDSVNGFAKNGVNGFTGTGSYTNFTIEGGIIINAT